MACKMVSHSWTSPQSFPEPVGLSQLVLFINYGCCLLIAQFTCSFTVSVCGKQFPAQRTDFGEIFFYFGKLITTNVNVF